MKKALLLAISLSLSLTLLTGCLFLLNPNNSRSESTSSHTKPDEEETDPEETDTSDTKETKASQDGASQAKWTVLLYMCGTDLESQGGAATDNLIELEDVQYSDNINFIIETGGTSYWQNDLINPDYLQRYKSDQDGLTLLDEQEIASMGDPSTLSDFLSWGISEYPADNYMVLFWNHGGGSLAGVEFDELYDSDSLTLPELDQAFEEVGQQFEVIGFDTCLMSTLENASILSPYGNYMVASEEYEPGGGWDYTGWTQYLMDNPDSDGEQLGREICDTYFSKCAEYGEEAMATLSVVDLKTVPDLVTAFDNMAAEMTGITSEITSLQAYVRGAIRAENFGGNTDEEGYTNMVDLGDLALNTKSVVSNTAEAVLGALFKTVVYDVHGSTRAHANGLSVFFPLSVSEGECDLYGEIATSGNYLRFIDVVVSDWSVSESAADINPAIALPDENLDSVDSSDYAVDFNTWISDDGYYYLEVTNGLDSLQSVMFNFYYMDYDYGEYMLMGTDNDVIGDWENGIYYDNFRGVWPALNGYYVDINLIEEGDDYNLYSIPIRLNGEETNLRAAYIWNSDGTGYFEVYGCWSGLDSETGMSSRDIIQLEDGDEVIILMDGENWDTGETIQYEIGSFIVDGPVVLEETELFDGDYLFEYEVTDVFGDKYYSEPIIMEYADGQITEWTTE